MSKQPPSAPTASAIGPCPTIIQTVGRPGTRSLPRTIAPPDHPRGKGTPCADIILPRISGAFLTHTSASVLYCRVLSNKM